MCKLPYLNQGDCDCIDDIFSGLLDEKGFKSAIMFLKNRDMFGIETNIRSIATFVQIFECESFLYCYLNKQMMGRNRGNGMKSNCLSILIIFNKSIDIIMEMLFLLKINTVMKGLGFSLN